MSRPLISAILAAPKRKMNSTSKIMKFGCLTLVFIAVAANSSPAQKYEKLANFNITECCASSFVQGLDGNFFTTGALEGANFDGTVFRMTPSGGFTLLYSFDFSDGSDPGGPLVLATDGNFYSTTRLGGTSSNCSTDGCGTVFRVSPTGALTTLYAFCSQANCPDGAWPEGLIQAPDGNFYGTTENGGANNNSVVCNYNGCGTVFEITPSGTLTTLHSFCNLADCADGAEPAGTLVQAVDGNFYGVTYGGGAFEQGTAFKLTPNGKLTTLYSFCSKATCTDGYAPNGGIVLATDGNLYGTTYGGGAFKEGTVFKLTPNGKLTTLHSFHNTDGESPLAGLVQGTDGNLYGTTRLGGSLRGCQFAGCGTVFQITPTGTLTTLHRFLPADGGDGADVFAGVMQATDGSFYGSTSSGGYSIGIVYKLSVGLSPFVETVPTSGRVGTKVRILGNNLASATSISFNGTSGTFTIISGTYIETTVPADATTGTVEVTTSGGTLKSNVVFRVTQ